MKKLLIVVLLAVLALVATETPNYKGKFEVIVFSEKNGTLDIIMNQQNNSFSFTNGENPPVYIEFIKYNFVLIVVKLRGSNATSAYALIPPTRQNTYKLDVDGTSMNLTTKIICAPVYGGSYCEYEESINSRPTIDQKPAHLGAQGNTKVRSRSHFLKGKTEPEKLPSNQITSSTMIHIVLFLLGCGALASRIIICWAFCFYDRDTDQVTGENEMLLRANAWQSENNV